MYIIAAHIERPNSCLVMIDDVRRTYRYMVGNDVQLTAFINNFKKYRDCEIFVSIKNPITTQKIKGDYNLCGKGEVDRHTVKRYFPKLEPIPQFYNCVFLLIMAGVDLQNLQENERT